MTKLVLLTFVPYLENYATLLADKTIKSLDVKEMTEIVNTDGVAQIVTAEELAANPEMNTGAVVEFNRIVITHVTAPATEETEEQVETIDFADIVKTIPVEEVSRSISIAHHLATGNQFPVMTDKLTGALEGYNSHNVVAMTKSVPEHIVLNNDELALTVDGVVKTYKVEPDHIEPLAVEVKSAISIAEAGLVMRDRLRAGVSDVVFDGFDEAEMTDLFERVAKDLPGIGGDMYVGENYSVNWIREQNQMTQMTGEQGRVMALRVVVPYGKFNAVDEFVKTYL